MADFAGVDATELDHLAADLTKAGLLAATKAYGVVAKGALNVKNDAKQFSSGFAHAPLYPASITYDVDITPAGVVGEIGPDKDLPQGALGNLLEYGSANNDPFAHLGPALDREGPRFVKAAADIAGDIL